jgi:hypothetical protein
MAVSAGLRVGSKFIILIFGIHPSGVSNPPAFAVRFLLREGGEEEDGDEEDMILSCLRMRFQQIEDEMVMFLVVSSLRFFLP